MIPVSPNGLSPHAFSDALVLNWMACSIFRSALCSLCIKSRAISESWPIAKPAHSSSCELSQILVRRKHQT